MKLWTRLTQPAGALTLLSVLALAAWAPPAAAESSFYSSWAAANPTSTSGTNVINGTGSSCALCHFSTGGGNNYNAYGWRVRQGTQAGQAIATAIANAAAANSDLDPTGATNLVEIGAGTQPGWTPGPNNTRYTSGGTTPGQTPLAGILGSLDPSSGTGYCFGDGTGTACPCGNNSPVGGGAGCLNSLGTGGLLSAIGVSSISADTLVLQGTGMPNSSALFFQGTTQAGAGAGTAFGDGKRCAAGTVIRLGTKSNAAGSSQYPVGADIRISVRGANAAGNSRSYQVWYRNAAAFCQAETYNLTNGWQVTWTP
ncbi:MAG: hypothetical protein NTY35_02690 [Planctomycetota bacterium]|nr:hypothetical protein [Planctomycetota bacterium]